MPGRAELLATHSSFRATSDKMERWLLAALKHPTKNSAFCVILHGICIICTYTLFPPAVHEGWLPAPQPKGAPGARPGAKLAMR